MDEDSLFGGADDGGGSDTSTLVDVTLQVPNLSPSDVMHVVGVISRVAAGLSLEGYGACMHTHSYQVTIVDGAALALDDEEDDHGE